MNKTVAVSASLTVKKIFLSVLSIACAVFISTNAFAQVEGCDPAVRAAMEKKAQAKVAYDVAVTEQIVVKPDSVLAMTCFNKSAGVSAERGGNIFSGSFMANTNFASVIVDALTAFFQQFADAEGNDSSVVDYAAVDLQDEAECSGIEDLWTRIKEKGVAGGVPYVSMDDLISGTLPGTAGTRFQANWETAASTDGGALFESLSEAIGNLPRPNTINFGTADTLCGVLSAAGVGVTC